jgi:SpoVK/Ycf46/Vps4 family AAA+-type ATPase
LVTTSELYAACRQQSGQKLNTLARQIQPRYTWTDIILPRDQFEQLREICSYVKHYHTVYGEWGFGRKLSLGKGLNVLFAGPSGTGKTMAAEIMANELGLDLYRIDLSAIVSKYIGETEKNLERIFTEAQTSNAILFFDEADALFGKRSEVRDSHDRYANIEIAYLLQRMEEYDGVVILATNLRKNMDEAFARRMHFAVEFPMPEEADRHRIWQGVFPGEAPLAEDIDLIFLARQFKISGGNIKNIALSAAFLAAADGGAIAMENLIHAAKREYQKMGKLCTETDFAQYFELVRG